MSDLQEFSENVFVADGPPVRAAGIPFSIRMIVVKLSDGALWINSPVHLPPGTLHCVSSLGPVKYLVAPTKLHVWRLEEWHALFPAAELWGPPQIPREFRDLPFKAILGDKPPSAWVGEFDQVALKGNLFLEEIAFLHKRSGTVILADFVQNHRPIPGRPLRNLLFKLAGVSYPNGGVPIDIRLSTIHRNAARQSVDKLLSWDFDKLILAHGVCMEKGARQFVERAFRWLMR